MSTEEKRATGATEFDAFVAGHGRRLVQVLTSGFGPDIGREAADEALVLVWQRWERVAEMDHPFAYTVTVGRNHAKRLLKRRRPVLPAPAATHEVRIEPGLEGAIARLPERRRQALMLVHGFGWTMSEVAEALGISKSSVQTHCERGLASIRRTLGVES